MSTNQRSIIHGTSLSPGLAEGPLYLYRHLSGLTDLPINIETKQIEEEYLSLDKATLKVSYDLELLAAKVEEEIDSKLAEVFVAHQMIVNDSSLREELRREISLNLINASSAVKIVMLRWEQRFLLMESQIAKDKGDDIHELSIRLQNALAGVCFTGLTNCHELAIAVGLAAIGTKICIATPLPVWGSESVRSLLAENLKACGGSLKHFDHPAEASEILDWFI